LILSGDEEIAVLEVTEDCDEILQASNAHAQQHPEHVIRDLRSGSGQWVFMVDSRTRVSRISNSSLQRIVDEITGAGLTRHDSYEPNTARISELRAQVGSHSVFRLSEHPDLAQIVFSPATVGSLLRSDPDLLVDYAEDFLARPAIRKKVGRLVERAVGRAALMAVVVSSATPPSVYMKMIGEASAPEMPSKELRLPDGLDGIWIVSGARRRVAAFRRDVGWQLWESDRRT
jgi:hypothetical protein